MLDVSHKVKTLRTAVARARVAMAAATIDCIRERRVPKGDPLEVAKVAAIQAAKNTSQIIPYCHPVPVDYVGVRFELEASAVEIEATVKAVYKTGVEMEAMVAASVAAITLYDMLKMLDETMQIEIVRLVTKTGGKAVVAKADIPVRAAVLVLSDSIAAGQNKDRSGLLIAETLKSHSVEVVEQKIIPDDLERIAAALIRYADEMKLDLVLTTGGTGFGPRDCMPEAMARVIERDAPGIAEAVRAYGQERTTFSMLSRARAGLRGSTVMISLPGAGKAVSEALHVLFPSILHAFETMRGERHD